MALTGEAKTAYQRELMRKRREEDKEAKESEWDREKYPVRGAWEVAVERAARAKRYASKFPHLIRPSEIVFQDIGWQYENEGLKVIKG
jgi:hypothetical protein